MQALFMTSMTPDSAAQADPQAPFVIESPQGTDWTVLYYPNTSSLPSLGTPLNRTINIVAVDQLKHALPTLKPLPRVAANLRDRHKLIQTVRTRATSGRIRHRPHLPRRRNEPREIRMAPRRRIQHPRPRQSRRHRTQHRPLRRHLRH